MSKHFAPPARKTPLKPSRIRRQPVKLVPDAPAAAARKPVRLSDSEQMWFGVTGVLIFAAAIVVLTVAAAIFTFTRDDPAAAQGPRFAQCYNANGSDCVQDGDNITVGGQRVEIAGIVAPAIQGARCDAERDKGIEAAMGLASLLNRGQVTVSPPARDYGGRVAQAVQVNGADVGQSMINLGLARPDDGSNRGWCSAS